MVRDRTDKGMKLEWATVKDDLLYLGSFGKEYTAPGESSHVTFHDMPGLLIGAFPWLSCRIYFKSRFWFMSF